MSKAIMRAALATNILASFGLPAREAVTIHAPDDNFEHNRVVAFNASAFAGTNPNEFLSNYAVRYTDPNQAALNDIGNFIAPVVPAQTSQLVEYALYNFPDGYLALDNLNDDIRGIGADFPTLRNPEHQLVSQRIPNRGIAVEVDEDEEALDPDWQQLRVQYLLGILQRTRLRRIISLFAAGATAVTKTWSNASANTPVDPDMDVINELENLSIRPTRILYGPSSWTSRVRAFRVQNTAGAFASAKDSLDDLANVFAVDQVQVVRNKYATGATVASNIVGSVVMLFIGADNLGRNDFSNMKTFTRNTKTGQRYATYVRQIGDKRWRIAVECYDLSTITSPIGMEVITAN